MKPLNDNQLKGILESWRAPRPAPPLEARTLEAFRRRRGFWWWLVTGSLRVPAPVAAAILLALFYSGYRAWRPPAAPRVVVRTQTVEVPVVRERVVTRTVYVQRAAAAPAPRRDAQLATAAPRDFQPVAEFTPRVVRNAYENRD